jgi:hypothetical protein
MLIRRTRLLTAALAIAGAAVVLTGCASGSAAPTPTQTASSTPTKSATPSSTPTASAASFTIPADCAAVGTSASRADTVDGMTMQSDGTGFVRPAPEGATLKLGCDWIVGDTTGILLLISTATPAAVTAGVAQVTADGYTCQVADDFGAQFCTKPGTGADSEDTVVARDDLWIYMETSNVNGRALLSDLATQIFG